MSRKNTFQLCLLALSTALIIVGSQLAVPLPGGVPFTLQTLVIPLIAAAFGWQLGTGAVALYLLLGAAGLPVFSGASGGIAVIFGPNGGFLWAFLPLALITGLAKGKRFFLTLAAGIALFLQLLLGAAWLAWISHLPFAAAANAAIWPFLPTTLAKLALVVALAPRLRGIFTVYAGKVSRGYQK
ncbi:MAG: biotin transporter BioY [Lactobacillus delbrueckii]|jgi:biotin transport system substrate-specific component|nr:biotin transporter BioY [Lactobacillus delbrueckii]MCH4219494.1 biotin transporter BioY [Lactobacillus delbrueckii]MCH4253258.1 biotin transporter BioY [Lactobacillus delbrueckii]